MESSTEIITTKASISYDLLNANLDDNIFKKLYTLYNGTCSKEYGYILNVKRLVSINDNIISSSNSNIIFDVSLEIEYIKPVLNQILTGKISMIFEKGLFIDIIDKFKILLPSINIPDYIYDKDKFLTKDRKHILSKGDIIKIIITQLKYENHQFKCIGKLYDEKCKYIKSTEKKQKTIQDVDEETEDDDIENDEDDEESGEDEKSYDEESDEDNEEDYGEDEENDDGGDDDGGDDDEIYSTENEIEDNDI